MLYHALTCTATDEALRMVRQGLLEEAPQRSRHELTDEALRMSSPSTVVSWDLSAAPRDPT